MLRVNRLYFDDLTKEEQKLQPNNGKGKECATYIKITDGADTIMILSDAAEPEDATFCRAFSSVIDAIEKAYKIGVRDGKKLASSKHFVEKAKEN